MIDLLDLPDDVLQYVLELRKEAARYRTRLRAVERDLEELRVRVGSDV